ncbi:hypothetical protein SOVF_096740, partial [Spinacia oleracea]
RLAWSNTVDGGSGAVHVGLSSTLQTRGSGGSTMLAALRADGDAPDGGSVSGVAISSDAPGSTRVIGYSRMVDRRRMVDEWMA